YNTFYQIKRSELLLNKYTISAPFDGMLTSTMVETGSLVRMNQKLGEFKGSGSYELELSLTPAEVSFLNVGDQASIFSDKFNTKLTGKVIRINPNLDPTSQTVNVYIQVNGETLKDGMYLHAEVEGDIMISVFEIPRRSLVDNSSVYVLNDSVPVLSSIQLISVRGNYAYIKGLKEGDNVVVDPISRINTGQTYKAIK
ncbi:efflux RND transporter periplasmic adaptor subunit, partial [Bacteroidota bacterium]